MQHSTIGPSESSCQAWPLTGSPVGQRAQGCLATVAGILAWVAPGSLSWDSKVTARTQERASWPSWADQYLWVQLR